MEFENNPNIETIDDGQESVVDSQDGQVPAGADDTAAKADDGDSGGEAPKKQSHEDNAAARAARLRAEADTRERMQREFDARVSGAGIVNPYTGEPFKNFADFEDYAKRYREEQIAERAKREKRPVAEVREEEENRDYIKRKRMEEQARASAETTRQQQIIKLQQDVAEFQARHPGVDPVALEQNAKFRRFCGARLYNEPLATLYEDYVDLLGEAESAAAAKAADKSQRGTGSGAGSGGPSLTPEQQAALDEWNADNPQMKMTPKEFLGR